MKAKIMSVRLTKRIIDGLPPTEKLLIVRDSELSGFSVRHYPSGRKAFFYRYRIGGGRGGTVKEPKIGDYGALTVDQARNIARDWAARIRTGADPSAERQSLREAPNMSDLMDRYLTDYATKHKKPSSLRHDIRMLEKELKPEFGKMRIKDVTKQHIRNYHSSLQHIPYEANRRLSLLSKLFNFAIDELEWLPSGNNPAQGVKKYPEPPRRRYLSEKEFARLGEALSQASAGEFNRSFSVHAIAAIRLLIFTGARTGEILQLRWSNVNYERKCLELSDSKTGAKDIQLSAPAMQILSELPRYEDNPYVIIGSKPGRHLVNVKDTWRFIREKAGISDVRIHDVRHSFASVTASAGTGLTIIGALMGHKSVMTTARYAHLSSDPLQAASEAAGAKLELALNGRINAQG